MDKSLVKRAAGGHRYGNEVFPVSAYIGSGIGSDHVLNGLMSE